ncbi:3-hydroxyacyl-CoA dehydrogenase family protein [Anaeroselena agilis]|uniref:L-gulonate 3-dehydrogenase n=1 Tax=Anaeroselena agilis TaxID=3063788 RepID=A0ABU3P1Q4_9FIRM|nr:3-hydroxyacyl-CoA dehydrogenase family protein [Selenomonadales bacterium 4137-cl]
MNDIKTICSVGTGTMGPYMAALFALAGYDVRMYGRSAPSVEQGFRGVCACLESCREHGLVTSEQIPAAVARIQGTADLAEAAAGADFVMESVSEDLAVKREVFAALEALCPTHAIFASNTSGLSPTAIASGLVNPERFVAAHFLNPPHLMAIVEVVPGEATSPATVDAACELLKKIGKIPVTLKREALGFIANRLQFALLREALHLVDQGIATAETVDTTLKHLSRRLSATGPLETADLGGLDVFHSIAAYLLPDLNASTAPPPALAAARERGDLGAKTGRGFYDWSDAARLAAVKKHRETILAEWLRRDKTSLS